MNVYKKGYVSSSEMGLNVFYKFILPYFAYLVDPRLYF
jgi:hypothetical protein